MVITRDGAASVKKWRTPPARPIVGMRTATANGARRAEVPTTVVRSARLEFARALQASPWPPPRPKLSSASLVGRDRPAVVGYIRFPNKSPMSTQMGRNGQAEGVPESREMGADAPIAAYGRSGAGWRSHGGASSRSPRGDKADDACVLLYATWTSRRGDRLSEGCRPVDPVTTATSSTPRRPEDGYAIFGSITASARCRRGPAFCRCF